MTGSSHPAQICNLGVDVPYVPALELQRSLRAAREAGAVRDVLLVLEHEPVVTCGTRTSAADIALVRTMDLPIVPVERGGEATWHGPGQVVLYPVLDLAAHGGDVRDLVRRLEQALIDTLAICGVPDAHRIEGWPGVWTGGDEPTAARKIASLGLRVTRGITFHGIALNVDCDLAPFSWFRPCGITDADVTSIARETGAPVGRTAVRDRLVAAVAEQFDLELQPVSRCDLERVCAPFPPADPGLSLPDAGGAAALDALASLAGGRP